MLILTLCQPVSSLASPHANRLRVFSRNSRPQTNGLLQAARVVFEDAVVETLSKAPNLVQMK